jgi:hypothetical protein
MHEQFIENFEAYGHLAKKKQTKTTVHDRTAVDNELYDLIGRTMRERGTPARTQRDIYHFQEKKQEIMINLKKQLADLDSPEYGQEIPDEARFIRYSEGKYFDLDGEQVSLGVLLTDAEWGIKYYLDPRTVPREVRKKFIIEQTKLNLQNYFDQQIIANETSRRYTDVYKQGAYRHLKEERASGHETMGHTAEKMVRTFLKKLSVDFPELDFEIKKADVFQDVQQHIDFIIRRRLHRRGVKVNVPTEKEAAGVQFTTNPEKIGKKEHQADVAKQHLTEEDAIDDIIVVFLPLEEFAPIYDQWKKKKTPGGPDKLWPAGTKEKIFRNLLKDMFLPVEIEQKWQLISGHAEPMPA